MTSKSLRKRRQEARRSALAVMEALTGEQLVNLRHELGREMANISRQANELRARLEAIKMELERRATSTPAGIHISDHALVRYMERIKGVDVNGCRAELADMALRARRDRDGKVGRRRDERTGLVIGVDETTTVVTTVFEEPELTIMDVA